MQVSRGSIPSSVLLIIKLYIPVPYHEHFEAAPGIKPGYADLQSAVPSLRHVANLPAYKEQGDAGIIL
jgi:hypothetical protein